ncbi:MAG: RICIN domain-containing protein, partial [Myxococcota bacterium]
LGVSQGVQLQVLVFGGSVGLQDPPAVTHVEVGAAGPGWWSAFWTFEGDCGRILKSDGTTEDEDLELDALADAKGIVTRIRNVGRPNLEMGVELVNNIATLVLEDMSTSPEVDVFHFTPVTSSDRTYNNMRLQHTLYPNQYVLPGQSNTLELGTLSNPSMLGFAVHRITDNVFVIYDRHTSRFVRAGEGVLELTHVYDENSKWRLEDVDRNYGRVGIEMPAFGKCLNVGSGAHGTQVTLWDCIDSGVGRANQEFEFIEEGEGSFRIFHPASGRCLNVRGGGMGDFTPLELANCVGVRPIQLFEMRFQPNTYAKPSFEVRSNLSGRCINLPYGRTHNGQGMHLMQCVGSSDQGPAHPFNLFTLRFR